MTASQRIAVVLGASAEAGTGWAAAETLAREGARVVVGARRIEPLHRLAERIGGIAMGCDAADPIAIAAFIDAARRLGPIDTAINCVGETARGLIAEIDPAQVQRALDVNFIAGIHFVRQAAAAMRDGGSITLVSSASSTHPVADRFAYGCAKAAMDALVRHAAIEFGVRGIRVNSVLPGPIRSEMVAELLAQPGVEQAFLREIPIGRIAEPQDIADAIAWLSRPGGYVTGLNLPASGGMHLMRPPRAEDLRKPA